MMRDDIGWRLNNFIKPSSVIFIIDRVFIGNMLVIFIANENRLAFLYGQYK